MLSYSSDLRWGNSVNSILNYEDHVPASIFFLEPNNFSCSDFIPLFSERQKCHVLFCNVWSFGQPLSVLVMQDLQRYFYYSHAFVGTDLVLRGGPVAFLHALMPWSKATSLVHFRVPGLYTMSLLLCNATTLCYCPLHFRHDLSLFPVQ